MPRTELNPDHNFNEVAQDNVADAQTLILQWKVPNNTQLIVGSPVVENGAVREGQFYPVIKLVDSSGDQIDGNTVIYIAGRADKSDRKNELVAFRYHAFRDLSTAEQRNRDYRGAVLQQLEGMARIHESNLLEVYLDGPDVADISHASTTFELPVLERRLGRG